MSLEMLQILFHQPHSKLHSLKESFPTGMETFNASARFAKLCTPLNKSPRSSAVLVELIQFAEKQIELNLGA